jgi:hypothetical protein
MYLTYLMSLMSLISLMPLMYLLSLMSLEKICYKATSRHRVQMTMPTLLFSSAFQPE